MTMSWVIGFVCGVLIVGGIIFISSKKSKKRQYDERQIAARGLAFKAGFITLVVSEIAVFFSETLLDHPVVFFTPGFLQLLIILVSLLVFLEIAIFKDAYFTPGEPFSKRWCALMILLSLIFIVQFIIRKDKLSGYVNFTVGIYILIIMLSIIIKHYIFSKTESDDGEEGREAE